jgi:CheY-like chemotaxis protein
MYKPIPKTLLIGWRVLVADDEPDSLEVASILLRIHGATVYTATDGAEALRQAKAVRPRFIISDLSMPGTDGWMFINNLKQDMALADIPVIALTAHAMPGDRERAFAAGFHNYLTKPLTPERFMRQLVVLLMDVPSLSAELAY